MAELSNKIVAALRGMSAEQLGKTLDKIALVRKYLNDVEEFALNCEAEKLRAAGYTTVTKYGRRRWNKTPDEIKRDLIEAGADPDEIENPVLISPAKASKIVGKDVVGRLSEVPESGVKLSRITKNATSYEDLFGEEN